MQDEPKNPYIYQPYGVQDRDYWERKQIYGISGIGLATVKGLTEEEATKILAILKKTRSAV